MDDLGYRLMAISKNNFTKRLGLFLVKALPQVIRMLKFVGTMAMTLVGGGIFVHNIDAIHQFLHGWPLLLADFTVGLGFEAVFFVVYVGVKKIVY